MKKLKKLKINIISHKNLLNQNLELYLEKLIQKLCKKNRMNKILMKLIQKMNGNLQQLLSIVIAKEQLLKKALRVKKVKVNPNHQILKINPKMKENPKNIVLEVQEKITPKNKPLYERKVDSIVVMQLQIILDGRIKNLLDLTQKTSIRKKENWLYPGEALF